MKRIPIIRPLFPSNTKLQPDIDEILASGQVSNGIYVQRLESAIAEYLGVKYFIAFCNGEAALIAMIAALRLSGEVIVPAYTFVGTPHAVVWNGLTPVFVDAHPKTWTINPSEIEAKITLRTSAILAVPIFGNPVCNDVLANIAEQHNLMLLYDSAQGFGSKYNGKRLGGFGCAESFSFHATKIFSTMEGGGVATNDSELYERLVAIRNFGKIGNDCKMLGFNGKMTEVCALVGLKNLEVLDAHITHRQNLVARYREQLADISEITFQSPSLGGNVAPSLCQILVEAKRDDVLAALIHHDIEARNFMSPPIHLMSKYACKDRYPVAEHIAAMSVALPLHSNLQFEEVDRVCSIIKDV